MNILIRQFEDEDAVYVADLIKYTLRTCNSKDYSPEYIEANVESHTPEIMTEYAHNGHFYVVVDSDRIIGIGGICQTRVECHESGSAEKPGNPCG